MHAFEDVGKPCPTCKREIVKHDFHDMDPYTGCSEFCARATDKEIEGFKNAKPGDFCVFPCAECGEPIEGEWYPDKPKDCRCSECAPKVRLRERTALLKQARDFLNGLPGPETGPIAMLVKQIDEVLS
jgi:hypothetical protein